VTNAIAFAAGVEAAIAGAASGALNTGTLKGALVGALSAVTFQQIGMSFISQGERVFARALAGGTLEALGGGKFGHGFVSAGLGKALSPLANTGNLVGDGVINAVIGGTISEITGGDFANGAALAATQYAFNALAADVVNPIPEQELNDPKALERAMRGLARQVSEHEIKLAEYVKDPLSKDNTGRLSRAISNNQINLVKEIIRTRVTSLQTQIGNFNNQIQLRQAQLMRITTGQSAQGLQESLSRAPGARVVATESALGYFAGRAVFFAGVTIGLLVTPANLFDEPYCETCNLPPPKK
jgi:hypothetical protein